MMRTLGFAAMALLAVGLFASCGSKRNATVESGDTGEVTEVDHGTRLIGGDGRNTVDHMHKGVIYRMSGDYSANVPVSVSSDGSVVSFPDPSDIRENRMPLPLTDGYWLDLRGVGANSVFTSYTYAEYGKLAAVPSLDELKAHIIPGSAVVEVVELPMRMGEAAKDTAAVNNLIRSGLPGCDVKFKR
jgi:hypothetical protein